MYGEFRTLDKNIEIIIILDCERVHIFMKNRDLSSQLSFSLSYTTCERAHKAYVDLIANDIRAMHEKIISTWLYKEYDVQSPSKYYANFSKEFADNFHKGVAIANKKGDVFMNRKFSVSEKDISIEINLTDENVHFKLDDKRYSYYSLDFSKKYTNEEEAVDAFNSIINLKFLKSIRDEIIAIGKDNYYA